MQFNYCISNVIDRNGVSRKCKNKVKNNNLCHIHLNKFNACIINKKNINDDIKNIIEERIIKNIVSTIKKQNDLLDTKYEYTLMNLYDSWNDVNFSNKIIMDNGEYWSVDIIINVISYQLNNSAMENPYPTYPNNPFNRKPFTPESLISLRNRLKQLQTPTNIALQLLLSQKNNYIKSIYNEVVRSDDRFSHKLLLLFEKHFRFMIVNNKNSQNIYTGLWVNKKYPTTDFEKIYNIFKKIPYQILHFDRIIDNPQRNIFLCKLDKCDENKIDINYFTKLL